MMRNNKTLQQWLYSGKADHMMRKLSIICIIYNLSKEVGAIDCEDVEEIKSPLVTHNQIIKVLNDIEPYGATIKEMTVNCKVKRWILLPSRLKKIVEFIRDEFSFIDEVLDDV